MNNKVEAIDKIKRVVEIGNLDISDNEIMKLVDDLSSQKSIQDMLDELAKENINKLNELGIYAENKTMIEVLIELAEDWNQTK